jgi:hypothetical protein
MKPSSPASLCASVTRDESEEQEQRRTGLSGYAHASLGRQTWRKRKPAEAISHIIHRGSALCYSMARLYRDPLPPLEKHHSKSPIAKNAQSEVGRDRTHAVRYRGAGYARLAQLDHGGQTVGSNFQHLQALIYKVILF